MVSVEAISQAYRGEIAKLKMELVLYRQTLLDNGIEPPNATGEDLLTMYNECRAVISTASNFVANLRSSQELLDEQWREHAS